MSCALELVCVCSARRRTLEQIHSAGEHWAALIKAARCSVLRRPTSGPHAAGEPARKHTTATHTHNGGAQMEPAQRAASGSARLGSARLGWRPAGRKVATNYYCWHVSMGAPSSPAPPTQTHSAPFQRASRPVQSSSVSVLPGRGRGAWPDLRVGAGFSASLTGGSLLAAAQCVCAVYVTPARPVFKFVAKGGRNSPKAAPTANWDACFASLGPREPPRGPPERARKELGS